MARRYCHSHNWLRLVFGSHGPPPTTRLVLCGHFLFMDPDGSNCRVGVRQLAVVTGLDKSTVAEHRASAIKSGWLLVSSGSKHAANREHCAAVPDSIVPKIETELSRLEKQGVSDGNGQPTTNSTKQVSSFTGPGVRVEPSNCPASPDKPLIPLLPLRTHGSNRKSNQRSKVTDVATLKQKLVRWVLTDERVKLYGRDVSVFVRLAPEEYRFKDYDIAIAEALESSSESL